MAKQDFPGIAKALNKALITERPSSEVVPSSDKDEARFFRSKQDDLMGEQILDIKNYRDLRNKYACRVFFFMCIWGALMFALLIVKGFWPDKFSLDNIVLTTLAGGTTVSVVGLVGFMMQGLFNSKQK